MWRSLSFFLALAAASVPAKAAEWWLVSTSGDRPNRSLIFMDKNSATVDYESRVSAWGLEIYETAQKDGRRKEKVLHIFDCKKRTMSLASLIVFGNNDRLINSYNWKSYEQDANSVVPDSVGEAQWEFACHGKAALETALTVTPEEFAAGYFRYFD